MTHPGAPATNESTPEVSPADSLWRSITTARLERGYAWQMYAMRRGFKLIVSLRTNGKLIAAIEQRLPPIHAVERVAYKENWTRAIGIDAMLWAEAEADRLAATP